MTRPERKFIAAPVQVEDDGRTVSGYAAVFGNVDWDKDIIHPGAFAKTLAERGEKVRVLFQHDPNRPLGPLLEAREDNHGLFVRFRISPTSYGEDALTLLREKALDGMSIAYDVLNDYVERSNSPSNGKEAVRHLTEMRLWEVSLVTFPANERATVIGLKTVSGAINWPLAERDREWDAAGAVQRIREWATVGEGEEETIDWGQYQRCFFWYDENAPDLLGSYKLPFCDIIDGRPHAVPRAIFAVAGALMGARGGVDVQGDDDDVKRRVATYYARMRREFEDDGIRAPWEDAQASPKAEEEQGEVKGALSPSDSMEEQLDAIKDTFYRQFTVADEITYWVMETHAGHLIVHSTLAADAFPVYRVPYVVGEGGVVLFAPQEDWIGGDMRFVEGVKAQHRHWTAERKEGRVLSSRNLDRLRAALEALQEILEEAEVLEEGEEDAIQFQPIPPKGIVPTRRGLTDGATSDNPIEPSTQPESKRAEPLDDVLALTRRRQQLRMRMVVNGLFGENISDSTA